jgi:subtilisin-like proprotein convertase family protein
MHQSPFRVKAMCLLALAGALPGADLLPDLTIDAPGVASGIVLDRTRIPGATLLRMPTVVPNIGQGAMEIRGGEANADGTQNVYQRIYQSGGGYRDRLAGRFIHHSTHGHIHFEDFAQFRLRARNADGSVGAVVRNGAKISFCLIDVQHQNPGLPGSPASSVYNSCGSERQGISVGWADVYGAYLDDQWVDITGVAAGQYWIEVITDPSNSLQESNEGNNSVFIPYTIGTIDNAVTGIIYNDLNVNGVRDGGEPGLAGWQAYLDLNNNAVRDSGVTTVNATEVPSAILDLTKVLHELPVSGISGAITDLNVKVRLTHTYDFDLALTLISPSGRRVLLVDNVGGGGDNFTDTVLTDEAGTAISAGTAPFTGSFRPLEPLSFFDGQNPNGTWKLEIADQLGGDAGQLQAWSLIITHAEPGATSDSAGVYRIGTWADGPVAVRAVRQGGWVGPTPAVRQVTLAGGTIGGRDFAFWRENRVTGTVFDDVNGNGARDAGEAGLGGWRIYDDANNNGVFDNSAITRTATDVPKSISDNTTVSSSLAVSSLPGTIRDIDLRIDLVHTYTGDLAITLVAPNGQRVQVFNRHGGSGDNIITTLNDEAASSITGATPPYTGSFKPSSPLSALDGGSPNGTWRLEVADLAGGDIGTLRGWSVRIEYAEQSTTSSSTGSYTLSPLRPGTHRIREVPQAGWILTTPVSGVHVFTFTTGGSGVGLFGNQRMPAMPTANG